MQPQMAVVLGISEGTSTVTESIFENRFKYVDELTRMGAIMKVEGNTAFITGVGSLAGAQVAAPDLRAGADDYIAKPFEVVEMLARVESVLRRYKKTNDELVEDDVVINFQSRSVTKAGKTLDLTHKEFELLVLLIRNKNIALYRDVIYENVWGNDYVGDSRTIDLHIQRLRRKLDWGDKIQSVYKVGYKLV